LKASQQQHPPDIGLSQHLHQQRGTPEGLPKAEKAGRKVTNELQWRQTCGSASRHHNLKLDMTIPADNKNLEPPPTALRNHPSTVWWHPERSQKKGWALLGRSIKSPREQHYFARTLSSGAPSAARSSGHLNADTADGAGEGTERGN